MVAGDLEMKASTQRELRARIATERDELDAELVAYAQHDVEPAEARDRRKARFMERVCVAAVVAGKDVDLTFALKLRGNVDAMWSQIERVRYGVNPRHDEGDK